MKEWTQEQTEVAALQVVRRRNPRDDDEAQRRLAHRWAASLGGYGVDQQIAIGLQCELNEARELLQRLGKLFDMGLSAQAASGEIHQFLTRNKEPQP